MQPSPRSNVFDLRSVFCSGWLIVDDYEVLGLQVTVATIFGNCFGAYIFALSFSRCQQRSRGDVRSPYVANIEPCVGHGLLIEGESPLRGLSEVTVS
ncbi:MAG: hypothetical protein ACK578_06080, partial [Pirellula sp.]